MLIIPEVNINREEDELFIPIINPQNLQTPFSEEKLKCAFFTWNDEDTCESFLKKYSLKYQNVYLSRKFEIKDLNEEDQETEEICGSDFNLNFYAIKDDIGSPYYLVFIDDFFEWEDLGNSFCIPYHPWNIHQILKEFSKLYKMKIGDL